MLSVDSIPEAKEIGGKIASAAKERRQKFDEFFWLKAQRQKSGKIKYFPYTLYPEQSLQSNLPIFSICNIVLQGGGVLGLAHAGFVAGMELAGVRFAGTAGASAGGIMAIGLAAVRDDDLLRSTHDGVLELVSSMPMDTFIDGPFRTRRLIKQVLLKRRTYLPSYWLAWFGALKQVLTKRGLNPGNEFADWLSAILAQKGLRSIHDLDAMLSSISNQLVEMNKDLMKSLDREQFPEPLFNVRSGDNRKGADLLKIMAASMPTGMKFDFPRDVELLSEQTFERSPAALVRASMSIPIFFEPILFDINKMTWPEKVRSHLGATLGVEKKTEFSQLEEIGFLDGGIFSNLPVDAFRSAMPEVPTIAVPLVSSSDAKPLNSKRCFKAFFEDAFTAASSVRSQRDLDAIDQIERERNLFEAEQNRLRPAQKSQKLARPGWIERRFPYELASIDTGDANWLNFVMDQQEMSDLFLIGMRRALRFISEDL